MNNLCYGCMKEKPEGTEKCPNCGYINGQDQGEHYYLPEGIKLNDRYVVGSVLGHGGFGITYIGLDTKFDTRVAIKEYLPSEISTRALGETTVSTFSGDKYDAYVYGLGRFIDEAKTLAKYNSHQCIVSINDYFEQNNTAYIVMEYLDGISLNEYLTLAPFISLPFFIVIVIIFSLPLLNILKLQNLQNNVTIANNTNLSSFSGMHNLSAIGGFLTIENNKSPNMNGFTRWNGISWSLMRPITARLTNKAARPRRHRIISWLSLSETMPVI